ncbi:M10 family metallopeptidase C-terminal domain-containing protein [Pseudomonas frederiksbergensis]|nr:M10 family metallopeptidase C-terminal domain-containing protein [Pseudomonas frederiksbergensis]
MSSPLGYVLTKPSVLTGNQQVDGLIYGTSWLSPDFGADIFATRLTYSFLNPQSYFAAKYSDKNEFLNSFALTSAQQNAVTGALGAWSAVANIKFTLVSDNINTVGDLRFGGYWGMDDGAAAWAYFPDRTPLAGDVWIAPTTNNSAPVKGTYDFMTFVHEIGHALGLKHPFESSQSNSTLILPLLDNSHYSIMSYNNAYSYQPTTPMLLDILAIQKLYGANMLWQTGNNVYRWAPDQSVFETLWDAGGNDTIDASNQLMAVRLNLNEGEFSNIGKAFVDIANLELINDGLAIAFGAKIENAIGSAFDDDLIGNALDNVLDGGAGQDIMIGGAGNDVYVVDNVDDVVVETNTSLTEIDTVMSSISYTLGSSSNLEYLTLTGGDNLDGTGNARSNRLVGNVGNNTLDGSLGADVMIGGSGNDTYIVDNLKDLVTETSSLASEIDTVRSSVSWTLGANLENLTLTGSDNLTGVGNALNNVLTGNSGNNILNGGAGLDTMGAGAGADIYVLDQAGELALLQETADQGLDLLYINYTSTPVTSTVDLSQSNLQNVEDVTVTGFGNFTVIGNDQNNTLLGNSYDNTLQGGAGNDWLDGWTGADKLSGGSGDDTYVIYSNGAQVTELADEGHDLIRTAVSYYLEDNVEDGVLLGSAALSLAGNELDNSLTGNAAANILDGRGGADTLDGGAGNDTYSVDNLGDTVIERGTSLSEIDTVVSSISYTLGSNLENLTLINFNDVNATGNALNNRIVGNYGDNTLDGGLGADVMIDDRGGDTYIVDNLKDVVIETGLSLWDIDTVRSSVSWTLGANLENLTLTGSDNLNGVGNTLRNVLTGNSGNNVLNGGAGLDTLIGGAGDDTYVLDQAGELALLQETADQGRDLLNISYASTPTTSTVDLSQSNLQNVENVTLTGLGAFTVIGNDLNNTLQGNASVNTLQGGAGNDWLDGGVGADILSGGSGDDTYVIDNAVDKIFENADEGRDLIRTAVSYTLSTNIEDGLLLGVAALNLAGNELDNSLTGNAAANLLDGKAGADTLDGGAGNDTYLVDNVGDTVIERGTSLAEIDTVLSSISYTLGSNLENLTLTGSDTLDATGNALGNRLTGNSGNNVLDGGTGADLMIGGSGNDTYIVDNLKDAVTETSILASEIDTVRSSVSWTLGANLENLTLTGSDNLNGVGNTLRNVLTGNSGNNVLNGGAGLDTLIGGAGDDTYVLDQAGELALLQETADQGRDLLNISYASTPTTSTVDLSQSNLQNVENVTLTGLGAFTVIGNDLNNTLQGNASVNTLQGGAGNDWLDGGVGADILSGGSGDDTYVIDNAVDKIFENADEGRDLIRTAVSYTLSTNIEDGLLLGVAALNLAGNELDNSLTGNAAANLLDGKAGADTLDGGAGNDTYLVDNVGDTVIERGTSLAEIDTVLSSISYTLGSNLENLTLTGSDTLDATGNALGNRLTGNSGNNVLDGGTGADLMIGGSGNDTYIVDNLKDAVTETSILASEIDTVRSSVSWTLGANLENLTLTGSDNLNGVGNTLRNVLTGNSGNNVLNGGAGLDTLIGGAGDDTYVLDQAGELALLQETADQGRDLLNISYASTPTTSTVDLSQSNLQNVENVTLTGLGAFTVIGNDLNNTLQGNASVNTLQGGAGNDWLDGGVGADILSGGSGDDTYVIDNAVDKIFENADEGRDLIRTAVSYTLSTNIEDGLLLGVAALNLAGNELDNSLTGNAAANLLDGKAGADTLDGGAGNDTYLVDNVGDTVIERGTSLAEIDTVLSSISYTLGSNLENLTLTGSDTLDATGNALGNRLTGNSGNNVLDGGTGADLMIGGSGNDTYIVDNLKDAVTETSILASEIDTVRSSVSWTLGANLENLTLTGSDNLNGVGNTLRNVLTGNSGNNVLNGGAGLDTLIGGAGDDTYVLDQAGELALLQETADQGRDLLNISYASTPTTSTVDLSQSNLQNVENVTLTGLGAFTVIGNDLNNTLQGNASVNTLQGGAGNDWLDGGVGADILSGGSGDDTYVIDNAVDKIFENADEGRDLIRTAVSYTLSTNIEDGLLLGVAALNLAGNELDNSLTGNAAANLLDGKAGADTLDGGAGNDTYLVDNVGDTVIERGTSLAEIDTVLSSISYTLGSNLENLTLTSSDHLNATGNALSNRLIGNSGNNVLDGGIGADVMIGGSGNDTYIVDNLKDVVTESSTLASEIDTVRASVSWTLGANLENLTLTGSDNLTGVGNTLNNTLLGNAGNNILNGAAGLDTLSGGAGDDTYVLDQFGELALLQETADQGRDLLNISYASTPTTSTVDLSQSNLQNVENVTLTGLGAFTVIGNDLNNTLLGNASANILQGGAGNDWLDGGVGTDILSGGSGDDTYVIDNATDKITELTDEGRDLIRTAVSYTLSANIEDGVLLGVAALNLAGNELDNSLTGNAAANILDGKAGADTLDGGLGADLMIGGSGNDTYIVDNLKDVVTETNILASEIDTVRSSVSWTLSANVENLILAGTNNLNGVGNALDNMLNGNSGNNVLNGGAGLDTLNGGTGDDTYVLDQFGELALLQETADQGRDLLNISYASTPTTSTVDLSQSNLQNVENVTLTGLGAFTVVGNDLNNTLLGNAYVNDLQGGGGNDWLDGGVGADILSGGSGDDTYVITDSATNVTELADEGRDLIRTMVSYTLSANVENSVLLGAAGLNLTGNELDNSLTGNAAANILDGKAGADTLDGGAGNDTYLVDNVSDTVIERGTSLAEIDTVLSSISYTLGSNLENLTLTSSDHLDATGNALSNRLIGNSGNNVLDGGIGADVMIGGSGNDTYIVDNLKDVVTESSTLASEIDTVRASVSWTLGTNLENLTLTGSNNLNGVGNTLNNVLTGNSGNNLLNGGAGNDLLDGGAGNDLLVGGLGADTLTGGSGADRFVFNLLSELGKGANSDVITDFSSLQGDKIDLSKLDANILTTAFNAFTFIDSNAFTGAGQLRFEDHVLYGNVNGTLGADFEIQLVGVDTFSANDLVA